MCSPSTLTILPFRIQLKSSVMFCSSFEIIENKQKEAGVSPFIYFPGRFFERHFSFRENFAIEFPNPVRDFA